MISSHGRHAEQRADANEPQIEDKGLTRAFSEFVQPIELYNVLNSRMVRYSLNLIIFTVVCSGTQVEIRLHV